jgi:hypothetical protein
VAGIFIAGEWPHGYSQLAISRGLAAAVPAHLEDSLYRPLALSCSQHVKSDASEGCGGLFYSAVGQL